MERHTPHAVPPDQDMRQEVHGERFVVDELVIPRLHDGRVVTVV